MSRSAQRGGGRADRTQISDHPRVHKLDTVQTSDFMTVQSHKNGHKAALLVSMQENSLNREDKLRTLATKDGHTGESTLRSHSRGENPPTVDHEATSYGYAQLKARVVQGGKRERVPSVGRAYQSLADSQGVIVGKSYEHGLKKAPRPRSNVRSNQRASVRPSRPEAANLHFGAAFLGQSDLTAGATAVTSHRYQ